jgi:hypothetical protein
MIIISVGFGLGNQMYEYAFLQMLTHLYPNCKFRIDTKYSFDSAHNGYELNKVFGISAQQCTLLDFMRYSDIYPHNLGPLSLFLKIIYKIKHVFLPAKKSFLKQTDYTEFYPSFLSLDNISPQNSVYFQGVFANEMYYEKISDEIKKIYSFPSIKEDHNIMWEALITHSESISMHIRRGDYIEWGLTLLSAEYYKKALNIIESKAHTKCEVFIFTDDVKWAEETFGSRAHFNIVKGNTGELSYRDMQLMSLCKHNIVANSSFSFWGPYLNKNPPKIVVAQNLSYDGCKNPFVSKKWILVDL